MVTVRRDHPTRGGCHPTITCRRPLALPNPQIPFSRNGFHVASHNYLVLFIKVGVIDGTMKIVTYSRVSTAEQTNEAQAIELRAYCEKNGLECVGEYSDVMGGGKAERPGLDRMLDEVVGLHAEAVVVVKLDRLGRSLLNVAQLVARLEGAGVALVCTSQGIDTRRDNPCGRLQMNVLAAVAEFERSLIRERTRAGLAVARANGKVLGRPSVRLDPNFGGVIASWRKETGGVGVRDLAKRLGGVSTATAARLARANP
jgi:DNA invertase Pin-like site-specific DNA recombinase